MIRKCWLFRFWGSGRLTAWETIVLGQTALLPGHTWFPPMSAVLLFVLHCLKRHCHPSYSMQLVIFATSQTAFVEAAESKASTICLINDLWSFYERVSVSLNQGQGANLMFNLPSSLYLQLYSRQGGQTFTVIRRFWKNLNMTIWNGQGKKIHHVERQRTPFLEIQMERRDCPLIFRKILSTWQCQEPHPRRGWSIFSLMPDIRRLYRVHCGRN